MDVLPSSFGMIATPEVALVVFLSSVYGLVIGCIPGLSATMATALLVPITFYLSPIAAVAAIISSSAIGEGHGQRRRESVHARCQPRLQHPNNANSISGDASDVSSVHGIQYPGCFRWSSAGQCRWLCRAC